MAEFFFHFVLNMEKDLLLSREKLLGFQYYAEKHDIYHLLVHFLEMILLERPESPIDFLIEVLQRPSSELTFY